MNNKAQILNKELERTPKFLKSDFKSFDKLCEGVVINVPLQIKIANKVVYCDDCQVNIFWEVASQNEDESSLEVEFGGFEQTDLLSMLNIDDDYFHQIPSVAKEMAKQNKEIKAFLKRFNEKYGEEHWIAFFDLAFFKSTLF